MAALGDPMSDVGWVCLKRVRGKSSLMSALVDKEVLFRKYEEMTGIKVKGESIFFWQVLGNVKLAAVQLAGIKACASGKNPDIRLATFEMLVLFILDELAELLGF
jgi:aminoglycoside phosphotransferase (APT) family kinase protein